MQASLSVTDSAWTVVQTLLGTGSAQAVSVPLNPAESTRYYRIAELP